MRPIYICHPCDLSQPESPRSSWLIRGNCISHGHISSSHHNIPQQKPISMNVFNAQQVNHGQYLLISYTDLTYIAITCDYYWSFSLFHSLINIYIYIYEDQLIFFLHCWIIQSMISYSIWWLRRATPCFMLIKVTESFLFDCERYNYLWFFSCELIMNTKWR